MTGIPHCDFGSQGCRFEPCRVHASASTTYVSGQLQARFDAWTLLGHFFQRLASSRETKNSTDYRVAVTIGSHGSSADVEAHRLKRAVIYIFNFLIIKCLQRDVFLLLTMLLRQSNDLADNDLRILRTGTSFAL
jgi:hypothetical protein